MLVESNHGSRINPEGRSNQIVKSTWRVESIAGFESTLWFDQPSSLRLDQHLTLHWHDQRKSLHGHDQRNFIIKTSEWLYPTNMLVESNPGSRINPRTRPNQDVSRVNPGSRIDPEGQFNLIVESTWTVESIVWFDSQGWFGYQDWTALPDWFNSEDWFDSQDLTRLTSQSGRVILIFW